MADIFEKEKNDPAMIAYLKALGCVSTLLPLLDSPSCKHRGASSVRSCVAGLLGFVSGSDYDDALSNTARVCPSLACGCGL